MLLTFRSELFPEILEVDVHVHLHGVKIFPELELALRESQVELPLSAVPVDGSQALHVPPLHQVLVVSGPEVDRQPAHSSPEARLLYSHWSTSIEAVLSLVEIMVFLRVFMA